MSSRTLCVSAMPKGAWALLAAFLVLAAAGPALAAEGDQPDWLAMGVGLLGGLA